MKIIKREGQGKSATLYGNKLNMRRHLAANVDAEESMQELSRRKILSVELIRMEMPHPVDVIATTYEEKSIVSREYKELFSLRTENERKRDERIFKTLEKILNKRDVKTLKASSFITEIIKRLTNDARYAYKQFHKASSENTAHSVYIYTVLAIVVATVSAINDIDFHSPVSVSMTKEGRVSTLIFKVNTKRQDTLRKRQDLIKIPNLESKLAYLSSLCREDEIKSTVKSIGTSVTFEYKIKEAPPEAPRVYAKEDEEKLIFNELLNAFNPPLSPELDVNFENENFD